MQWLHKNTINLLKKNLIAYFPIWGMSVTTLLSTISSFSFSGWLEVFSHFKLQYCILNLLFLLYFLMSRDRKLIIISFFCLSLVAAEVVPWYIPNANLLANKSSNFRVLSLNFNIKNQRYAKVLSLVRQENPDLAVFMELNLAWKQRLTTLHDLFPYSISNTDPNQLGIAVYSKHPLENASIADWGSHHNPIILGNLVINGRAISVVATHPPPPKPGLFEARNRQLYEISRYIKSLSGPTIVLGDLNITMWSPYYRRFVKTTKLRNARQGFGLLPTWPRKTTFSPYSRISPPILGLLSIPIDHCLVSPDIKVVSIHTGVNVNSDHLPLIADLMIPVP
jgi:endonuclease/exonuclease/phosphatase (EEP) superfamily protein YafD